jgi:hypothetical protein
VSEVKVNSNMEEEWRWLDGNCNPADLGMRSNATPQDMAPNSEYHYHLSMPWMMKPEGTWPCKKSFSLAPEELRKDMLEGNCNVGKGTQQLPNQEVDFPSTRKGGLD